MDTQPKSDGQFRKDFYKLFEGMVGRNMTEVEHNNLKQLVLGHIAEAMNARPYKDENRPKIHNWICDNCKNVVSATGKDANDKMRRKNNKITSLLS